jgi:glycosyltransferase involved in cell wall biosynthesis
LTELVKHEINGLVVEPANATAMGAAITRVLVDEKFRQQLEQQAYKFAIERLSFETMMEQTINMYQALLKQ